MVMFLEILKTLLQILSVFSILLVAFGMAFFMLMNKEVNMSGVCNMLLCTIGQAFYKSAV